MTVLALGCTYGATDSVDVSHQIATHTIDRIFAGSARRDRRASYIDYVSYSYRAGVTKISSQEFTRAVERLPDTRYPVPFDVIGDSTEYR